MRHPFFLAACLVASTGDGLAQTLVSPVVADTAEGNYDNSVPFGFGAAQQSYLQIHDDIAGRSGTFTRLSFRRDGVYATNPALIAKTIDASVWFGQGVPIANLTSTFAANFAAGRTQVVSARTFNMPSWTQRPVSAPAAFDVLVPLDAPYTWTGAGPFAWEMRVTDMSATHPMFADAVRTEESVRQNGFAYTAPCSVTGGSMSLSVNFRSNARTGHELNWIMQTPRPSVPAVVWIGTTRVNIPVAGLCRSIGAEPTVMLSGATGTDGGYYPSLLLAPYQRWLAGLHLYSQAAALDQGRADPIPFALTAAIDTTIPAALPPPVARLYHASDATATTGFLDPMGIWLGSVIRLD